MKFFTKEIKIAIVAIVGLIVVFFGMNFLKGLTLFSDDISYQMTFEDVSGLSKATPIYANGYQVGGVKAIDYTYHASKDILVTAGLNKYLKVPKGSTAEIQSDLMGNVRVNLILEKNSGLFIQPGGTIPGGINSGALGKVGAMVPSIEKMLPKLDSIMFNLNKILSSPAIQGTLNNIETLTSDLQVSAKHLNTLMTELNKDVPGMVRRANKVLDNTSTLTGNLAAIDVAGTMAQVNQTLANVQSITDQLNSNTGSLGLLMRDPSLYNNLNATLINADSLLLNVRQHPKRYVHFSLFGKKDK